MTKPDSSESVRKLHKVGFYKLSGKVLGKGNFARVEEGIHTLLNTKVAIKVLDTSKIKEKYVAKNLDREARMLAKLEHPSIMCLYETMRVGPIYYLVTELATGGDLCTYIKRHRVGKLDERCARRYGWQIISALAHMHKRGIVHRDLKMENIMLDASREHVKIVDFGLSNTWKAGSLLQTHCGSPEYAAPELFIVGKEYGPEVDLWSLGVVLYGMVTGRLPFLSPRDDTISPHEKRRHLLLQINRGLTPMQMKALGDKSSDFRNLVQRLLTPNTEYRLTLEELLFHPWVTLRQKKSIPDIIPTPPSPTERNCMMEKIAVMTSLSRSVVEKELSINSYGSVGGMYNIMAHMKRLVRSEINGVKWTGSVRRRSCSSNRRPVTSINKQPCELSATRFSSVMRPKTSPIEHLPPTSGQTRVHGTQLRTVKPSHTRTSAAQPADWSKRLCYITQPTPYMLNGTSRAHNRNQRRNLPQNANETYCPRTPQTAWPQTTRDIKAKLQVERRCITPTEEHCKGSSTDTKRLLTHLLTTTSVNNPSSAGSINKRELMHRMNQMQLLGIPPNISQTNRMSMWAPQHLPRSTNASRQQMEQ